MSQVRSKKSKLTSYIKKDIDPVTLQDVVQNGKEIRDEIKKHMMDKYKKDISQKAAGYEKKSKSKSKDIKIEEKKISSYEKYKIKYFTILLFVSFVIIISKILKSYGLNYIDTYIEKAIQKNYFNFNYVYNDKDRQRFISNQKTKAFLDLFTKKRNEIIEFLMKNNSTHLDKILQDNEISKKQTKNFFISLYNAFKYNIVYFYQKDKDIVNILTQLFNLIRSGNILRWGIRTISMIRKNELGAYSKSGITHEILKTIYEMTTKIIYYSTNKKIDIP